MSGDTNTTDPADTLANDLACALLTARFGGDVVQAVTKRTVHEALVPALLPVVAAHIEAARRAVRAAEAITDITTTES